MLWSVQAWLYHSELPEIATEICRASCVLHKASADHFDWTSGEAPNCELQSAEPGFPQRQLPPGSSDDGTQGSGPTPAKRLLGHCLSRGDGIPTTYSPRRAMCFLEQLGAAGTAWVGACSNSSSENPGICTEVWRSASIWSCQSRLDEGYLSHLAEPQIN